MSDRKEIIPVSNPINKDKKAPLAFISFQDNSHTYKKPEHEAVNVLAMSEVGTDRDARKQEVLNFFPDNSPDGAKVVEDIVNKTTGFNQRQMSSLLSHMRLKDFRDKENFISHLNQGIEKIWLDDLLED